jgi:lipopolysaccharide biosynthesis glycosyltransferase
MTTTVQILHCFDNNFVVPAGVAIHSLLAHADPACRYRIHILHSDISAQNQARLRQAVAGFVHAELVFVDLQGRFGELFEGTRSKGHYSKEMFYKFLAPSILPDCDKVLISDVDVVFLGDVSRDFLAFDVERDGLLAGSPGLVRRGSWVDCGQQAYRRNFSPEEIAKLRVGAGYFVANLAQMRAAGLQEQLIDFATRNAARLLQPEQDAFNLVCAPHIKLLPADSMVCSYSYDFYRSEDALAQDLNYSATEVRHALDHPIQLHYAGVDKPWKKPATARAEAWYEVLARTPFLAEGLTLLERQLEARSRGQQLFAFDLPLSRRRIVVSRVRR